MSDEVIEGLRRKIASLEEEVGVLREQARVERADATRHAREECARVVERFAKAYPGHRTVLNIVVYNVRRNRANEREG